MRYENVFYGFSMELPEPWIVETHGRRIGITDKVGSLILTPSRNPGDDFRKVVGEVENSLQSLGVLFEKRTGEGRAAFRYQTPTEEFLTVIKVEKKLILSLSAPLEEFEDYREEFEKILKGMEFDVERIPVERKTVKYSSIPAFSILVPRDAEIREIPFELGGTPELFYEILWEDETVGRGGVAYSNTNGFVLGTLSGPISPPSSLECREFLERLALLFGAPLREFSGFKYPPEVVQNMLLQMSITFLPQQTNIEAFEAWMGNMYLLGEYFGTFAQVGFFPVLTAGITFHYGSSSPLVQSVASSLVELPSFKSYRMRAFSASMRRTAMERNRIFQRELESIRRHNAEMSAMIRSTFDEINRNIMDSFYADLNQSYRETIDISDALSGYTKVYDDYGNVYRLEDTGGEYFINELGDTILAVDRDVLLDMEDDLKFWGWKRLKKEDETLW